MKRGWPKRGNHAVELSTDNDGTGLDRMHMAQLVALSTEFQLPDTTSHREQFWRETDGCCNNPPQARLCQTDRKATFPMRGSAWLPNLQVSIRSCSQARLTALALSTCGAGPVTITTGGRQGLCAERCFCCITYEGRPPQPASLGQQGNSNHESGEQPRHHDTVVPSHA